MKTPIPTRILNHGSNLLDIYLGPRIALLGSAGWVTGAYVMQQVLRLGTSVILAWLLAPELLGIMLLINTLRTGVELLTDVGIGQSIVNNSRGNEPSFYNTAWTIQIIRGFVLFALALVLSVPVAEMYENSELKLLLPVVAPIFILAGFMSTSRFLLQKQMKVRKLASFDLAMAALGAVIQIALAAIFPTIWSLIWGLLISCAITTVASFFLIDWKTHKLQWDVGAVKSIIQFGKWIFVSTLIYFLAMNFDRLYFADVIPIALLGVYGIARTFSETIMLLFQRIGNLLIFPQISASPQRGADLRRSIGPIRMVTLIVIAAGMAVGIALADEFIFLMYDQRYHAAGFFLTVLLFSTWFSILATISDAMMMGVGKPSGVAISNGSKFAVLAIALPFTLSRYGINAAITIFVVAEVARYVTLMWQTRNVGIGFSRQDIFATIIFIFLIFAFRELTMLLGITGGVSEWISQAQTSYA